MKFIFRVFLIFLLFSPIFSPLHAEAEKEEGEEKEEKGNHGSDSIFRSWYDVGQIIVPVIKRNKVVAYMRIKIQILTKDGSPIDPYRDYKYILLDAYFTDIYQVMCDRWLMGSKAPTQEAIHKRLIKITNKVVGSKKLKTIITNYYFYFPDQK